MERVVRVRGAGRDDNDEPVAGTSKDLYAVAVSPGASTRNADRGRNGRRVSYTVYFWPAADLQEGDLLRVRGDLCETVVQDWRSPWTGRRGHEVLCSAGKG